MISSLDVKDKENAVRLLELKVQELKLNDRITQLKAEQLIDESCVGCCKVVDVAARLQTKLDEYKKINGDQLKTIHYLKQEIVGRKEQLMEQRERTESKEREVLRLKDKLVEHANIIEELKDRNSEDLHELYDIDKEEIDRLKAELYARKHDSKVLKEVVDIVGGLMQDSALPKDMRAIKSMKRVENTVKDYLNTPEVPPETPIDETQDITVTFAFLELP